MIPNQRYINKSISLALVSDALPSTQVFDFKGYYMLGTYLGKSNSGN